MRPAAIIMAELSPLSRAERMAAVYQAVLAGEAISWPLCRVPIQDDRGGCRRSEEDGYLQVASRHFDLDAD